AYGITHKISLYAGITLPLFAAGLSFLAALIGVLVTSLIPWFLTAGRIKKTLILILIIVAFTIPLWSTLTPNPQTTSNRQRLMINRLLEHSRITLSPIFPGYWAAEGFIQGVKGRFRRSLGFLAILAVNLLLAWQIVELTAERSYHRTWSLYKSRGVRRRKFTGEENKLALPLWERLPAAIIGPGPDKSGCKQRPSYREGRQSAVPTDRFSPPHTGRGDNFQLKRTLGTFNFFTHPTRALIIKDLKTFIREPAQWLQAAILFGLLTIYIINIKNMPRNVYQPFWKNLITFFNLGATSLILATLTTRFVYPSLSLEGRTFWVLGLAPIRRAAILRIKFWSSFIAAVIVTVPLMLLSNHILEVSGLMTLITCGAIVLMAGVLVSLATGLGAIFPQFTEDNPSRIASGFGGTLNLVLSLIYIAILAGGLGIISHLKIFTDIPDGSFLLPGIFGLIVFSLLGIYLPLKLGLKALRRAEF
ncbi:MAG: hypothetical protein U9N73_01660, partial [Candidatus Auribacterota bacterium]|nr:hypothetical protein [Candidatus Auribacterota bacterium]